ncbi:hypothetical protein ACFV4N_18000 [Actinosynnema sp. NPDC059797]
MRRRALPPDSALVVVEGVTDKRALFPFVSSTCFVVPAAGKDRLITAFESLDKDLLDKTLFILDCDGSTPQRLKGRSGLILTVNRDLEADLLFELQSLNRIVADYFADSAPTPSSVSSILEEIQKEVAEVTQSFGMLRKVAGEAGFRVRVKDTGRRNSRKIRLYDLGAVESKIGSGAQIPLAVILDEMSSRLGWNNDQKSDIASRCKALSRIECRHHGESACKPCGFRKYCNGHDIVDALAICLSRRLKKAVRAEDIDRMLRMSSSERFLPSWEVYRRVRNWESDSSLNVFSVS